MPGRCSTSGRLNEPMAGQSGFVRLSADGNDFVLGDGTPARFWAVGSGGLHASRPEVIERHVKFLARMGVNMVRLHAQIAPKAVASQISEVDGKEVDGIWRFVAEAKKQGIYTTISPYWAHDKDAGQWGIEGYAGKTDLYGLLFFDETLQEGYKGWVRTLYTRVNPYTGIPLSRESAVALIQIQNEDSLFFWDNMKLKPPQLDRLSKRYSGWIIEKYGSIAGATKAWAGASHKDDDLPRKRVALLNVFAMTQNQEGGMARRVADEVSFYATIQRRFYAMMAAYYRDDLGCGQLINACNWKTADGPKLDDIERWTYTTTDVIAVNRYYNGGSHLGPQSSWRIDPGDRFSQKSALLDPRSIPINLKQVVGHPMIVTEGSWVTPLAFQAEGPFLSAVYQSLTGIDAFYWFKADQPEYALDPFFTFESVRGQLPLLKFSASIPPLMGSFPAAAVLFRRGYVKQGEPVVHEERTTESLRDRVTPIIAEDPSFDPNRDRGATPTATAASGPGSKPAATPAVDPLAFLVGPVEVKYEGDPAKNRVVDLAQFIDRDKKMIRSVTGEVSLDYGKGLCTVDTPKAQGACGFLARSGPITLHDLAIKSTNAYATVLVVPLDDQPLATSRRVLVQVATAARPTGWQTRDADFTAEDGKTKVRGLEVVTTGKPPWRVARTEVGIALKNSGLTRATRLDPAGFPAANVAVALGNGGITLTLPPDTMYLLLD